MTDTAAREAFEDIASRAEYQAGMFASIEEYQKVKERVLTVRAALSAPQAAQGVEGLDEDEMAELCEAIQMPYCEAAQYYELHQGTDLYIKARNTFQIVWKAASLYMRLHASQPQKADVPDADSLNIERILHHVRQITRYRLCMSYNDSYFGEPEGHLKSQVAELERLLAPHKTAAPKPAGGE